MLYNNHANSKQCDYSLAEVNEGTEGYILYIQHALVALKGHLHVVIKGLTFRTG